MAEEANSAQDISFECSYNERARNDQVYVYLEDFRSDEIFEGYLSVADFRAVLKAMTRLDGQL